MSLQVVRAACPPEHQKLLDEAVVGLSAEELKQSGGVLANLIALLQSLGLSINWPCLIGCIPQIIAAFSNPALIPAIIVSYLACANPAPKP